MFFHIIRNAVELAEIYFFAFHFHEMLMPFAEQEEDIPFLHMVEGIFYCLGAVGYLDILTRSAAVFRPIRLSRLLLHSDLQNPGHRS